MKLSSYPKIYNLGHKQIEDIFEDEVEITEKVDGRLEYSIRDMPLLLKEIQNDTFSEEEEWIKDKLFKWAWPKIRGSIVKGFAEYYKDYLLEKQFKKDDKE